MTSDNDPDLAIEVRQLRRTYGTGPEAFEAVRGLDLDVRVGAIHALLGVNGAGKTSTLEVIEGLAAPTSGMVRVLGLDPIADRAAVRRRTGVLLQKSGFVGDLTVAETLQMWTATVTDPRPVPELLEMLHLERVAQTRMRGLSGGEQRRVDLACTLSGRPDLVMLDEPTTGLDPESRRAVWQLVRDLRDRGATVLLTTHYLDEAEELADVVSIMASGQIVEEGTVAQVVSSRPASVKFTANRPDFVEQFFAQCASDPQIVVESADYSPESGLAVIRTRDLQATLTSLLTAAAAQRVTLANLDARTATLESAFLALAAEHDHHTQEAGAR